MANTQAFNKTLYEDNPCHLCTYETGRAVGCHSTCQKYIDYRKNKDKQKENYYNKDGEILDYYKHRKKSRR